MTEKLVGFLLGILGGIKSIPLGREIISFVISMCPILELRGGILAARALGLNPIASFIICYIGNILPVPFIILLIKGIINKLRDNKVNFLNKFVKWIDKKVEDKKGQIEKYGFWGLVLFIGIPLPGTGAWTGCLIAAMLDMDKKKSFIAACIGVLMAGIIMSILSIGLFDGLLG